MYATELSEGFIQHLRDDDRIEKDKVEIIHSKSEVSYDSFESRMLAGTEDDLCLPTESDGSVDLAVLCDVYHHLTHPRTIVQQLKRSLKGKNLSITYRLE